MEKHLFTERQLSAYIVKKTELLNANVPPEKTEEIMKDWITSDYFKNLT